MQHKQSKWNATLDCHGKHELHGTLTVKKKKKEKKRKEKKNKKVNDRLVLNTYLLNGTVVDVKVLHATGEIGEVGGKGRVLGSAWSGGEQVLAIHVRKRRRNCRDGRRCHRGGEEDAHRETGESESESESGVLILLFTWFSSENVSLYSYCFFFFFFCACFSCWLPVVAWLKLWALLRGTGMSASSGGYCREVRIAKCECVCECENLIPCKLELNANGNTNLSLGESEY